VLMGYEAHAVKFGLRSNLRLHYIQQKMTINRDGSDEADYQKDLVYFKTWMVGPVIYYSPSVEVTGLESEYSATSAITMYALFGVVDKGEINKQPLKNELEGGVTDPFTEITGGYKIDVGVGGEVSVCSVNLGLNLFYSHTSFEMRDAIYPTIGKKTTLGEICVEVYMGIPIGTSITSLF
jgi:hypothetical protein